MSQPDSLYLTQCNFVLRPIVKFGCSRRFMPGHLLGVLEASVVFQINRDASRSPGVTSDGQVSLPRRYQGVFDQESARPAAATSWR
jgi:hypothetical protein